MAEGLAYCLQFRNDAPPPTDTSDANLLKQVDDFCLDGLRGSDHARLTLPRGGEITGTINWLIADRVTAVNFYTTLTPVPMLFVSLPENSSDDWRSMPGFMKFVKETPQTLNLGEIKLDARLELDQVFKLRFAETQRLPRLARETLMRALGGGGNLDETLRGLTDTNIDRIHSFF